MNIALWNVVFIFFMLVHALLLWPYKEKENQCIIIRFGPNILVIRLKYLFLQAIHLVMIRCNQFFVVAMILNQIDENPLLKKRIEKLYL